MTHVRQVRYWLTLTLLLVASGSAWAEVCSGSKVKKADLVVFDQAVELTQPERTTALQTHLPFGIPPCPKLLVQREFVVCYDLTHRVPQWAAYTLTSADLGPSIRFDAFRTDPRLTDAESAHCKNYAGSGYDRGHNVPRCDMNRSPMVQANTYFFSNMSPQRPIFNRGMWRWLEESVRAWVAQFGEVQVITGTVFLGTPHRLQRSDVRIPREFFKIVVRKEANGDLQALPFLLIHGAKLPIPPGTQGVAGKQVSAGKANQYLEGRLTTIDALRILTDTDFFPDLPLGTKTALEQAAPSQLWPANFAAAHRPEACSPPK